MGQIKKSSQEAYFTSDGSNNIYRTLNEHIHQLMIGLEHLNFCLVRTDIEQET